MTTPNFDTAVTMAIDDLASASIAIAHAVDARRRETRLRRRKAAGTLVVVASGFTIAQLVCLVITLIN
jgi:hypothetical protein